MNKIAYFISSLLLVSCSASSNDTELTDTDTSKTTSSVAPIESDSLTLLSGLSYNVLFSEGDTVITHSKEKFPAKGNHDLVIYLPKEGASHQGQLFVSHETATLNYDLGHGGGATVFDISNSGNGWRASEEKFHVDFSSVGYTIRNCGGKTTPSGTILMAEESIPGTSSELIGAIVNVNDSYPDTLHENFGWIVEVDPIQKTAIRKLTAMGRYSHEDAICLPDSQSVILTNDGGPGILYKFVATNKGDYSIGQLYAYSETAPHWIELPMDLKSLSYCTDIAISKGATMFLRHEWGTLIGDNLYITETGKDSVDFTTAIANGGIPASYFESKEYGENKYHDPYGRILKLNIKTNEISVFLEGGFIDQDKKQCFSNPDCINHFTWNNKPYLIISEDIIGLTQGRVSTTALEEGHSYNEVFLAEVTDKTTSAKQLIRIAAAPRGCETTGLYFTPDQQTLFMSIQHPNSQNKVPFNKTSVIAITGF